MNGLHPYFCGEHPIFQSAELQWVRSGADKRLRLAIWRGGSRGTIHIFNGRTEYIEKYGEIIAGFVSRGYSVTAHDWRGQGLSTRNDRHPKRCHIRDFAQFQEDAQAVLKAAHDLPKPRILFCHSMGGAIGLRTMMDTNLFDRAIMSAPMWGIQVPTLFRPFTGFISKYVRRNQKEWACVPGTSETAYELETRFRRNMLTSDRAQYEQLQKRLDDFPELSLGGPTFYWYFAANSEIKSLRNSPKPDVPMLIFLGSDEKIVSPKAIRAMVKFNKSYRLVELQDARHEVYLERPDLQQAMWSHIDAFLL